MEVADQWRRQWAGTAEFGKVTEGGVTRRVARAMEVLHASGPGARVRVMRAAYHSSAGPGAPAESFMLHSSRRVISSGFNFLEPPPSLPTKPLEISSTPLEFTHDSNGEAENYKVTEPDDLEISEPSKWRGSTRGNSVRMPSEESSSTDNASIIDLDSKNGRNLNRKYSYDSESSELQFRSRSSSRTSQLLDAPTTLSTLKYKSLLNNSNDWNTRRKSYSFEDTSPLNETILHNNDTLAMESSTDSGICKSTEIVNDHVDDNSHVKYFGKDDRKSYNKEESFRDWLSKNRQNTQYRGTKFKTYREHDIVVEEPKENNIALKSSGKVSITVPITIEGDSDNTSGKTQMAEDAERRVKRVEFCKTEVHFAAESGKVNIIATDEKPPPSTDFRKRRSAFVPMQDMIDRPITLFGEKTEFPMSNGMGATFNNIEFGESDENTAATKSILKNKIPKPKPYLLGENMDFGISDDVSNKNTNSSVLTAVSLVNQQIDSEKQYKSEIKSIFSREAERNVINKNVFRTIDAGPPTNDSLKKENHVVTNIKIEKTNENTTKDIKNKLTSLHISPVQVKPKTRQLRQSDLTFFGIDQDRRTHEDKPRPIKTKYTRDNVIDDIFHSVKLIQQVSNSVSNSVCNSDPESEEVPEYQNVPLNINYAPVPTPRLRSRYDDKPNEIAEVRASLKPIAEKDNNEPIYSVKPSTRRTRVRRQEEVKSSRSLSEPPKNFKRDSLERSHRREDQSIRSSNQTVKGSSKKDLKELHIRDRKISEEDIPIYVNVNIDTEKLIYNIDKPSRTSVTSQLKATPRSVATRSKNVDTSTAEYSHRHRIKEHRTDSGTESSSRKKHSVNKDTLSSSLKREAISPQVEKASKSYRNSDTQRKVNDESSITKNAKSRDCKYKSEQNNITENKKDTTSSLHKVVPKNTEESGHASHDNTIRNRDTSSHRKRNTSKDNATEESVHACPDNTIRNRDTSSHRKRNTSKDNTTEESVHASRDNNIRNRDTSSHRKRNTSKDNAIRENVKPTSKLESDSRSRHFKAQTKDTDREKEYGSKSSSHKSSKQREYVINYDDKNGTVSSVCKIKPGVGSPRRKKTSKEILKENHKDNTLKTKTVDKIALRNAVGRSSRGSKQTDLPR